MSENGRGDWLGWLGANREPDFRKARWLGGIIGAVLILIFLLALVAAVAMLIRTIVNGLGESPAANLGTGALIVALLSSPFLIWNTVIRNTALGYQKEGHLTDRLSKAVEQLGAEKTVQNIGRPVTIWTTPEVRKVFFEDNDEVILPERSEKLKTEKTIGPSSVGSNPVLGTMLTHRQWMSERTVIQWLDEELEFLEGECLGSESSWEVFTRTVPTIEVRIGALLSLERIAQDSVTYDRGRDHVRVMEILCAYVRENAPASAARDDNPRDLWEAALAKAEQAFHVLAARNGRDEELDTQNLAYEISGIAPIQLTKQVGEWAQSLPPPRPDIQVALDIIGRRNAEQLKKEAEWGRYANPGDQWIYQERAPSLQNKKLHMPLESDEMESFKKQLGEWMNQIRGYRGYRLNLRNTNLQCADLSSHFLGGATLFGAKLEGAILEATHLVGADLEEARLEGAHLQWAILEGANLKFTRLEKADLSTAQMKMASMGGARLQGAKLVSNERDRRNLTTSLLAVSRHRLENYKDFQISQDQIETVFCDRSVDLPNGLRSC